MKIKIENLHNPDTVSNSIILIKGSIENYPDEVWKKHSKSSYLIITHDVADTNYRVIEEVPLKLLKFKLLCHLYPGENTFYFEFLGVKDSLKITYSPSENDFKVKLVYVICSDHDGSFQSPDADNSKEVAVKKISLAAQILQCFVAESLHDQRLDRKTFSLEATRGGSPLCHIHHTSLTTKQTWAMSSEDLWKNIGRELMTSPISDKKAKYLAFLSSTRYFNCDNRQPESHQEILDMTKGHVALGGGGLALFGTGCLWTWPTNLSEVQAQFSNCAVVDCLRFMDDSAYRGTVGGCYATTFGAVIHELGHCFDLGHSDEGIMARGFDDIDAALTLVTGSGLSRLNEHDKALLKPCSVFAGSSSSPATVKRSATMSYESNASPKFTSVRRSDSVTRYLEEYAEKRHNWRKQQMCSRNGCFWSRSCALILSHQKWLNDSASECESRPPCSSPQISLSGESISSCCGVAVAELRGERGSVLHYWEGEAGQQVLQMEQEPLSSHREAPDLMVMAITFCGLVLKQDI